ncbi:hypothetical protein WJX84_007356 [Apatococcus fuscideae]|uniref:Uncharacterized protein n=1 Tax=Apatococcus fuscideae TaxID=2026836 RepID=A0AAW1T4L4_9CHLO
MRHHIHEYHRKNNPEMGAQQSSVSRSMDGSQGQSASQITLQHAPPGRATPPSQPMSTPVRRSSPGTSMRQSPSNNPAGSMEAIAQAGRHFCGFKDSQGFQGFAPLVVAPRPAASNASGGTARSQAQPRGPDQLTQPPQRACSLQSQEARSPSPIGRPAALDTGPQAQPSTRMPRGHSGSASARQPDATPPRLISKKAASQRHSTGSLGGRSVSGHHQGMRHDQSPSQGDHAHVTAAQTDPPFSDQRAASAEAARPDQQTSSSHLSHATSKKQRKTPGPAGKQASRVSTSTDEQQTEPIPTPDDCLPATALHPGEFTETASDDPADVAADRQSSVEAPAQELAASGPAHDCPADPWPGGTQSPETSELRDDGPIKDAHDSATTEAAAAAQPMEGRALESNGAPNNGPVELAQHEDPRAAPQNLTDERLDAILKGAETGDDALVSVQHSGSYGSEDDDWMVKQHVARTSARKAAVEAAPGRNVDSPLDDEPSEEPMELPADDDGILARFNPQVLESLPADLGREQWGDLADWTYQRQDAEDGSPKLSRQKNHGGFSPGRKRNDLDMLGDPQLPSPEFDIIGSGQPALQEPSGVHIMDPSSDHAPFQIAHASEVPEDISRHAAAQVPQAGQSPSGGASCQPAAAEPRHTPEPASAQQLSELEALREQLLSRNWQNSTEAEPGPATQLANSKVAPTHDVLPMPLSSRCISLRIWLSMRQVELDNVELSAEMQQVRDQARAPWKPTGPSPRPLLAEQPSLLGADRPAAAAPTSSGEDVRGGHSQASWAAAAPSGSITLSNWCDPAASTAVSPDPEAVPCKDAQASAMSDLADSLSVPLAASLLSRTDVGQSNPRADSSPDRNGCRSMRVDQAESPHASPGLPPGFGADRRQKQAPRFTQLQPQLPAAVTSQLSGSATRDPVMGGSGDAKVAGHATQDPQESFPDADITPGSTPRSVGDAMPGAAKHDIVSPVGDIDEEHPAVEADPMLDSMLDPSPARQGTQPSMDWEHNEQQVASNRVPDGEERHEPPGLTLQVPLSLTPLSNDLNDQGKPVTAEASIQPPSSLTFSQKDLDIPAAADTNTELVLPEPSSAMELQPEEGPSQPVTAGGSLSRGRSRRACSQLGCTAPRFSQEHSPYSPAQADERLRGFSGRPASEAGT